MKIISKILLTLGLIFSASNNVYAGAFEELYGPVTIVQLRQMQTRKFKISPKWKIDLNYGDHGYKMLFEEAAKDVCDTGHDSPGCGKNTADIKSIIEFDDVKRKGNYIYVRIRARDYWNYEYHTITYAAYYDMLFHYLADAMFVQALEISPAEIQ